MASKEFRAKVHPALSSNLRYKAALGWASATGTFHSPPGPKNKKLNKNENENKNEKNDNESKIKIKMKIEIKMKIKMKKKINEI